MDSLYLIARDMTDADSSDLMIDKLLKETRASDYTLGTINLVLLKAVNLYNSGKFDQALKVINEIEPEVREAQNYASLSHLLALKANCYGNLFYFEKSREHLLGCKFFAEKIVDDDSRYYNLGRFYRLWAVNIQNDNNVPVNLDSVMYYRKKSYNIQLLILKNKSRTPLVIESAAIGNLFLDKGKLDSAKHYFQISQALTKRLKVDKFGIESLIGLGQVYDKLNKNDSALYHYKTALKFSQKAKRVGNIKLTNKLLAALYEKIGDKIKHKNMQINSVRLPTV